MSGAPEAAGAPEPAPTRGWRVARAALWVYAPQLLALALSPVTECSHCVATFWTMFLVLPGFLPLLMFPLPALLPWGVAVAMTLGLIWCHDAFRDRSKVALVVRLVLAAMTALNAIAFGHLIRM
ncbi:MAG: hypothetical protein O3C51_12525 [Planctomycetota bacterium]|nr:hypothetical protein [Planctomycetota bacterium]